MSKSPSSSKARKPKAKQGAEVAVFFERFQVTAFMFVSTDGNPIGAQHVFRSKVDAVPNIEEESIAVVVTVDMAPSDGKSGETWNEEEVVASIVTKSLFKISNIQQLIAEGQLELPEPYLVTLLGTSIGATRGAFADRLSGTPYNSMAMPILRVEKVLNVEPGSLSSVHGI